MKYQNPVTYFIAFIFAGIFLYPAKTNAQKMKQVPSPINQTKYAQKSPSITPDGKYIAFLSDRGGQWDIYLSQKENGQTWQEPKKISSVNQLFSGDISFEGISLNYNGDKIYFGAHPKGNPEAGDIYYTKRKNGKWGSPEKMSVQINTSHYEGMPSISTDNNKLFFVRKNNSPQDKDIYENRQCKKMYFAERNAEGEWDKVKALPSPVNLQCDATPRFMSDEKTLIMASVRPPKKNDEGEIIKQTEGGYDLYYSKRIAQRIWSAPEILDINTPGNDMYPTMDAYGETLYFSSTNQSGNSKIYKADISEKSITTNVKILKGKILDKDRNKPFKANINTIKKSTSEILSRFKSRPNGTFFIVLPPEENYVIDFFKENYSHTFLDYNVKNLENTQTEEKTIGLYHKAQLLLNVFDAEIYEPLAGNITVTKKSTQEQIDINPQRQGQGRFLLHIPIGSKYSISVNKEHYKSHKISSDFTGVVQFKNFEKDIELQPKKEKMTIDVADAETDSAMAVDIVITNLDRNEKIVKKATKNKDGKYVVSLREGDEYEVNVNSPKGYAFYNTKVDMSKEKEEEKMDVNLKPLKAETKLQLENITFETNSAELNASSYEELDRVIELLANNANIRIEISAHTDDVGRKAYNVKLSQRRAQSVVDYLLENDVVKEQLEAHGYGESQPLVPNNSEENRARNRRVELEILEVLDDGTVKQRAESQPTNDQD